MKTAFATLLLLAGHAALCVGLLEETTEATCHSAGGKWLRFWLVDQGDNGMSLDIVNTEDDSVIASGEIASDATATSKTFSFCLDWTNEDAAPCYGIVTSTEGENHDDLSWIVKLSGQVPNTGDTVEALRSGDVFDAEFIACGKQYKKLGRYVINQLEKSISEDAGTQNNVEVRTYTKMESKAIELGIQYDTSSAV